MKIEIDLSLFEYNYERLRNCRENLEYSDELHIDAILNVSIFQTIDGVMKSLSADVRKGIMKIDWNEKLFPFIGQYLRDTYTSDGSRLNL